MYKPDSWLVKFYGRVPVFFQNIAYSIVGHKNKKNRYGKDYFKFLSEYKASQWWEEERIASYQSESLRKTFISARQNVPFYQADEYRRLCDENLTPEERLSFVPVINKSIIKASAKSIVSNVYRIKKLQKNLTSGTSGEPLCVYHTKESFSSQWAIWGRHKARFGVNQIGDKFLTFGARVPVPQNQQKPPYWRRNWALNQVYLSIYHLGEEQLPEVVKLLQREQFAYFTGYPSAMRIVAEYLVDKNIRLENPPNMIFTGSDALSKDTQYLLEKAFGASVSEQYGMAEGCGNFSKCEHGNFHLDFEFGFVEYLDLENDPESEIKRMVFTGFSNDAMPLIRYDVGDLCIPSNEICSCGRKSQIVKEIVGRKEDYIETPDGRKVQGMNQVFEWAQNTKQMQIVQRSDRSLVVKYVTKTGFEPLRDLKDFKKELHRRVGEEMVVEYQEEKAIQKSKNGKYKAVISLLEK